MTKQQQRTLARLEVSLKRLKAASPTANERRQLAAAEIAIEHMKQGRAALAVDVLERAQS